MSAEDFSPLADWSQLAPATLLERIGQAEIYGMGGGGFSTARKLQLARQAKVTRVIANAVECEPGIAVDAALLAKHSAEVVQGLCIVMTAINATQGVLAYAADFPGTTIHCIEQWLQPDRTPNSETLSDAETQPTNQPTLACTAIPRTPGAGAERSLCKRLFDLTLDPTQYPIEQGVLCLNVGTLFAIQQAVVFGKALRQRLVTVNGRTDWVTLGTRLDTLLDVAEQPDATFGWRYRVGGHYTGKLSSPQSQVTAATNAVWLVDPAPQSPCTYCSRCSDTCPEALAPQTLLRLCKDPTVVADGAQQLTHSESTPESPLAAQGLWRCTECGLCNNQCPSNIDLLGSFQQAKTQIAEREKAALAATRARQRHERHLVRTEARAQLALQRRESRRASRRLKQRGPDAWR